MSVRLIRLQAVHDLISDMKDILLENSKPSDKISCADVMTAFSTLHEWMDDEWHDEVERYFIAQEEEEEDNGDYN